VFKNVEWKLYFSFICRRKLPILLHFTLHCSLLRGL
jgi:hypothetical protein